MDSLLGDVQNNGLLGNRNTKSKEEVQKYPETACKLKVLHGQFRKATDKVRGEKSWDWLKKGYLKKETASTIIAAQNQVVSTNSMRTVVFEENVSLLCRLCGMYDETANIVSEFRKLPQKVYKRILWQKLSIPNYVRYDDFRGQKNGICRSSFSSKLVFLKKSQISQENTCAGVSF